MAAIKYLDYAGLQVLVPQITTKISEGDAKAFKNFVYDETTRTLKIYKAETVTADTVADFTMTLPADVDVSGLLEKLEGATEGNVIVADVDGKVKDGGVALSSLATKAEVEAVDGKADANTEAIAAINNEETGILKQAKDYADGKDTAIQAAKDAADAAQADVDTLEQTHATDKAALEASIKGISDDYLKATDKEELQENIDTVNAAVERLTNGVSADEVDGVNDLIQYVKDHGTEVTGMQSDISDNADAIEAVADRTTTLEGEMDTVEAAVATKVEQEVYNTKVAALEGEDTAIKGRLDAIEEAIGEGGDIASQIDTKIGELDADVTSTAVEEGKGLQVQVVETDGKVTAVNVTGNFNLAYDSAGSATAAQTNAQTYADGLNTAMDTRVDALETLVGEGTEAIPTDDILAMFA